MKTDVTTPGYLLTRLAGALLLVALAAPALSAQGSNDPIGGLPKNEGDPGGGSDATQVDEQPEVPQGLDEMLAGLPGFVLGSELVPGGPTRSATAHVANDQALLMATPVPGQSLQASIDPEAWPSIELVPAEDALWSQAVLVLDSAGGGSLPDLIAGNVPLDAIHPAGVPSVFDVDLFAALADKLLPAGTHATWIIISIDSAGVVHHAAARCGPDGGDAQIFID